MPIVKTLTVTVGTVTCSCCGRDASVRRDHTMVPHIGAARISCPASNTSAHCGLVRPFDAPRIGGAR